MAIKIQNDALKCNCGFALIFFNFVILPFIFHKSLWFSPWSLRICPCFDRWLGVKSQWLVNSEGKNRKVKKMGAKSKLHLKVGVRTQMPLFKYKSPLHFSNSQSQFSVQLRNFNCIQLSPLLSNSVFFPLKSHVALCWPVYLMIALHWVWSWELWLVQSN